MTKGLPKLADVEKESEYGFVFSVSGPGIFLFFYYINYFT